MLKSVFTTLYMFSIMQQEKLPIFLLVVCMGDLLHNVNVVFFVCLFVFFLFFFHLAFDLEIFSGI